MATLLTTVPTMTSGPDEKTAPSAVSSDIKNSDNVYVNGGVQASEQGTIRVLSVLSAIGSTFIGVKLFGISVPLLSQLPLIIYCLLIFGGRLKLPVREPFVWFEFYVAVASLVVLLSPHSSYSGFQGVNIYTAVTSLAIFLPLIACYSSIPNGKGLLRSSLIVACRFECIWGIAQMLAYTFLSININEIILGNIFHLTSSNGWLLQYNAGTATAVRTELRMAGTTSDGAFFGLFLIIGLVIDKRNLMRAIYILAAAISVQRATVVCMVVVLGIYFVQRLFLLVKQKRDKTSPRVRTVALVIMALTLGYLLWTHYGDFICTRIELMVARFADGGGHGTNRHLSYIPWSIEALLSSDLFTVLFGTGLRTSGVLLSDPNGAFYPFLDSYMRSGVAWAIECDIATVVAGTGLIGFILYASVFYSLFTRCSKEMKTLTLTILLFGVMYDFCSLAISVLVFSLLTIDARESKRPSVVPYEGGLNEQG